MFGYRLLRESDYDRLVAQLDAARAEVTSLQDARAVLIAQVGEAKASERSKASAVDHLTVAANEARMDAGQLRAKLTGIPSTVPQLGTGTPLNAEGIGAGVDLFSDVGDERAEELRNRGLLHDDAPLLFPSAESLVPSA